MAKVIAIVSGGMDSATLAYQLVAQWHTLHMVTFDYGQRHRIEIEYARRIAKHLHARHDVIDLSTLTPFLSGSALTDTVPVPYGHYTAENMKLTVVPNRNAIMLSVAWGLAVAEGAELVATAVHSGDHAIYPDCRPEFIDALNAALRLGTEGHRTETLYLHTPFIDKDKAEIARLGDALCVPYEDTWTCYEGGTIHCGKCGACVERREAFELAEVSDPTVYQV